MLATPNPQQGSARYVQSPTTAPKWSFTASTGPHEHDVALVVYRLSIANLGLGKLSEEVEERFGAREAMRWRRARTREYVTRLRDQLRLHLSNTELIIHADEADADDRMQVIATLPSGDVDEIGRLEREISDRVEAISKRTWIAWSEGLRVTMSMLEELEGAA